MVYYSAASPFYFPMLLFQTFQLHCKKRFAIFTPLDGMSLIKLFLARDGKTANLFYSVRVLFIVNDNGGISMYAYNSGEKLFEINSL